MSHTLKIKKEEEKKISARMKKKTLLFVHPYTIIQFHFQESSHHCSAGAVHTRLRLAITINCRHSLSRLALVLFKIVPLYTLASGLLCNAVYSVRVRERGVYRDNIARRVCCGCCCWCIAVSILFGLLGQGGQPCQHFDTAWYR